jgi:hypothetical protein
MDSLAAWNALTARAKGQDPVCAAAFNLRNYKRACRTSSIGRVWSHGPTCEATAEMSAYRGILLQKSFALGFKNCAG